MSEQRTTDRLLENLRLLRPTAKFEYSKDQFLMIGQVMREAADEIERLIGLEDAVVEYLKFREKQDDNLAILDRWVRLHRRQTS